MNDPHYCELKAVELVTEARRCLGQVNLESASTERERLQQQYHEKLTQAIGLLALARLQRGA